MNDFISITMCSVCSLEYENGIQFNHFHHRMESFISKEYTM